MSLDAREYANEPSNVDARSDVDAPNDVDAPQPSNIDLPTDFTTPSMRLIAALRHERCGVY
jgi:hypothetical protein